MVLMIQFTHAQGYWNLNGNTETDTAKLRIGTMENYDFQFLANGTTRMRLTKTGFLGIGTNFPTEIVDVNGNIRLRNGAANNFILTSDANGVGAWKALNLQLTGSTLSLSNHATGVNLSGLYTAGTGISITGTQINNAAPDQPITLSGAGATSISGGYPNFIITSTDNDQQILSLNNNRLEISGGNFVDLDFLLDNTDEQNLTLTGQNLTISNGNTIDLSTINTDNQNLSITGNILNISNGTGVILPEYTAGAGIQVENNIISAIDESSTNEIQQLEITGHTLTLTNGGGIVILPDENTTYSAGAGLSLTGTTFSAADESSTNEIQQLTLSGHNLTLSNGGGTITIPDENTTYTAGTGISITNNAINSVWTKSGNNIHNNNSQNVGIGITDPKSTLHIHDGGIITGSQPDATNKEIVQPPITIATSSLQLTNQVTGKNNLDGFILGTLQKFAYIKQFENAPLDFYTNNLKRLTIAANGKIGIGTANPSATLDVNGNVRIATLTEQTASTNIITADNNGVLGKRSLSSIADNLGNHSATMNVNMNDNTIYLHWNGDTYHGLKYASSFASQTMDGPALFGYGNGVLGTKTGIDAGSEKIALFWNSSGNVGIGVVEPAEKLEVNGGIKIGNAINTNPGTIAFNNNGEFGGYTSTGWKTFSGLWSKAANSNDIFYNVNNSRVGIGTSEPTFKLEVNTGTITANSNLQGALKLVTNFIQPTGKILELRAEGAQANSTIALATYSGTALNFKLYAGGSIVTPGSISSTSSITGKEFFVKNGTTINTKIANNGHITCRKVIVKVTGDIGDFIFNPNHQIPTLYEEENFYLKNKHLKGIPSAKEVLESGMDVDEFISKLLQKIEVTTIHNVTQQKQIDALQQQIETMQQQISSLKNK